MYAPLFVALFALVWSQTGRAQRQDWQLIYEVSKILRERHGHTGGNIAREGALGWRPFEETLAAFKGPLAEADPLDLSLARNFRITAYQWPKITRFSAGWFSFEIPARTRPEALIPLLQSYLELHRQTMDMEEKFRNPHGYHKNGIIAFEPGIGVSSYKTALERMDGALDIYTPREEDGPLFGDTRRVMFFPDGMVRIDQHLDGQVSLEIPVSLAQEDYGRLVFTPLSLWGLRKRAKFVLRDRLLYKGSNAPTAFGGVDDEAFRETLTTMVELTRRREDGERGAEEPPPPVDLSNVRHIFISPGNRPWTRRYMDGRVGLHVPVDLPREQLMPALEMALFPREDLEGKVLEEFQTRGFGGEGFDRSENREDAHRVWLENLWLAIKTAGGEKILQGVHGIRMINRGKLRAHVDAQGAIYLEIPAEMNPEEIFPPMASVVSRAVLRRKIEDILTAHSYRGRLEITLGFNDDDAISEGFERMGRALEEGGPPLPDLSLLGRLTLSPRGERFWSYTLGGLVYLHIPMDTPVEEIVPLIIQALENNP